MANRRDDRSELSTARVVAVWSSTLLIVFTVMADALGRLLIRPDFHVSELLFGTLVGAWLALLGIESAAIVVSKIRNGNGKDRE